MPSRLDEAVTMMRAKPIRTLLLAVLPIFIVSSQLYLSTDVATVQQSLITLGFASVVLVYSVSVFRIHLARHRITVLES